MSIAIQRWTIDKVFTVRGANMNWRWTYTLRDGPQARTDYATAKEATKAAERAWKVSS